MREVTSWTGRETRALRKAMRLTIREFAEHLDIAERTVSYWESSDEPKQPRQFHQSMLDTVFSRLDEGARSRFLALLQPTTTVQAEATPTLAVGPEDEQPPSDIHVSTVRSTTIVQLHAAADIFTQWDHQRGAVAVSQAANAQVRWARSLLALPCPDQLRRDLYNATAHLGLIAGFVNFDAHSQDAAAKIFSFAAACAREAGDPHLEAKLLSHQARQLIYCGMLVEAFPLLDKALMLGDLTGTEQAMLHTGRARLFAKQGRIQEAITAIRHADNAFEKANPQLDPTWMAYYDTAQHFGDTGHALFDLAVEGTHEKEAIERFSSAVAGHTAAYARSRAMSMIKLASLHMATGEPQQAVIVAAEALPEISQIGSQRVIALLRELLRYSTVHRQLPEVEQLRAQLSELVAP